MVEFHGIYLPVLMLMEMMVGILLNLKVKLIKDKRVKRIFTSWSLKDLSYECQEDNK